MVQIQNSKRLPWLDITKAIAMIAVVFSHEFATVKPLVLLCNSFMLPLFFICSGFCLSPGKYETLSYIKRKAKTLLLPYIGLGMLVSLLHVYIDGYDKIANNVTTELFSWQTLWFLPVLFVADIFMYLILTIWGKSMVKLLVTGVVFLFVGMFFCKVGISLPINLEVVPISVFYLTVGFFLKELLKKVSFSYYAISGVLLFVGGFLIMVFTKGNLVLKLNDILPVLNILFSTMEGVGIMLILSTPPILEKFKMSIHVLEYIGKNTMVIFAFHMPIFFYCQKLLRPLFNSQLYYKPLEFILIWGVCFLLIPVMNRYAPLLIGKNKKK